MPSSVGAVVGRFRQPLFATAALAQLGTLHELSARPGMPSEPSLRRFIAAEPDFPAPRRGRRGAAYLIDLDAAEAFVRARWRDGRNARRADREARERADDLPLPFMEM